ncbi:polysaccharide deacetylase family protein [Paenibacillus radicibacter]|uniref:polysaccharide deacetylase family protein n=1 Tax=Paenibacillus radicibacter TaxID=2972488 RepID=UPI002158B9C6|nr:polysaccharide deacetylase family protein [Paenibacillus radicibacter]
MMVLINQLQPVRTYISEVKRSHVQLAFQRLFEPVSSGQVIEPSENLSMDDSQLMQRIQEEAKKRYVAPTNARVDRVWKLVPSYNGVEVDEVQTYRLAKNKGTLDESTFVYRELSPKINMDDLGSHPIYRGNPQKPMVSLMINVAWGNEFLNSMLNTLRQENVKATFFFDGTWLNKNLDVAARIREEGHELSNHAYTHKNMSTLSRDRATQEIVRTQELLTSKLGVTNRLFAPPSGDFDQETVDIAMSMKMRTILWTLDTIDWKNPGRDAILSKISARIEAGSLILMHPTISSSQALPGMIRIIKERGLAIGTVSELISPKRVPDLTKVK